MYKALEARGMYGVSSIEFLMNTMLYLVYDGGHSMHEVMWVANSLDAELKLGLNLGDPSNPVEFVSDYNQLVNGCEIDPKMKVEMETAMENAWK